MNPFFERLSKIPTIVYMANRYGLSHNEVAGIASASLVDNGVVTNTDTTKLISPKKVAWQRETIANAELEKRNLAAKEVDCLLFDGKIIDCLVRKSGEGSPTKNGKLDVYAIVDGSTSQYLTHIEKKVKEKKQKKEADEETEEETENEGKNKKKKKKKKEETSTTTCRENYGSSFEDRCEA